MQQRRVRQTGLLEDRLAAVAKRLHEDPKSKTSRDWLAYERVGPDCNRKNWPYRPREARVSLGHSVRIAACWLPASGS